MRNISPSLLSANFNNLQKDIKKIEECGISRVHLDVMDGHFVPNLTFGPFIIKQLRQITQLHFETHLMITEPRRYFDDYIDAGSDTLIFHVEASDDISGDLKYIQSKNVKAGVAINPDTDIEVISNHLENLDYILIMSVFPGFGGQSFIENTLNRMKRIVEMTSDHDIEIGVDGGVNLSTINEVYKTGIDITIVGSGLFKAENLHERYKQLLHA